MSILRTLRGRLTGALLSATLLVMFTGTAQAASIQASDSGWFDDSGAHTGSNQNYSAGFDNDELRNFFVFDLSPYAADTIVAATLRLYNPAVGEPNASFEGGYDSPDLTESYNVVEVLAPSSAFATTSVGNTVVFNDLGDGPIYGSATMSASDNGSFIEIVLNAAGVAAVDSAIADFVIGGFVSTLTGTPGVEEFVFGHTDPAGLGPYSRELIVLVPEPSTALLLGFGMTGFAIRRRLSA